MTVMGKFIVGEKEVVSFYKGPMGIKKIYLGSQEVYNRPGGYCYLELDTKGEVNNG